MSLDRLVLSNEQSHGDLGGLVGAPKKGGALDRTLLQLNCF